MGESEKEIHIKIHSVKEDPTFQDSEAIVAAREQLLALDTAGKLIVAPNQLSKGELEMWQVQLFEPRQELNGQSAYEYFDKIIFGHGEGPENTDQRVFQGQNSMDASLQGTIGDIKKRHTQPGQKVLSVVCGTDEKNKITLSQAIRMYVEEAKK